MECRSRRWIIAVVLLGLCAAPATAPAASLKPVAGKKVVVEAQGGTVTIRAKGAAKATRLRGTAAVPLGATIDATKGKVGLLASGKAKARLSGGAFVVTQKAGLVTLTLTGGGVRCAQGGTPGTAKRKLRFEGSGRFRIAGCYAAATTKASGAKASAIQITVGADGTVILLQDGPGGTSVELIRGTAVQVLNYLNQNPQLVSQGGTITFLPSGQVLTIAPVPTPVPPVPPAPPPPPASGSCAGGVTDSATDAVQDPIGPLNPLPDLLCASVVRDGANIVVTTQASQPIPDANRPEAYFYSAGGLPGSGPAGAYLFPCNRWLDMRQRPPGFLGQGVYDCAAPGTVVAAASFGSPAANTYTSTFAAAPAGLTGAFYWRVVLEGSCDIIDTIPDRTAPPATTAC
jgi:hypothetical protein